MLRHLKWCIKFMIKPKKLTTILSMTLAVETPTDENAEELVVVVMALQAFSWQRNGPSPMKNGKPFIRFNCSLCDELGHNSMGCPLRPFLLDALSQFKQQLATKQAKEAQAVPKTNSALK